MRNWQLPGTEVASLLLCTTWMRSSVTLSQRCRASAQASEEEQKSHARRLSQAQQAGDRRSYGDITTPRREEGQMTRQGHSSR